MPNTPNHSKVRLDKWLWAARFFKTRGLAKTAIDRGKVRCAGQRVKAAREITIGETLTIQQGFDEKEIVVAALSEQRRSAPEAALLYTETDTSRLRREKRAAERKAGLSGFLPSDHKPTKKERRQLRKFRDDNQSDN